LRFFLLTTAISFASDSWDFPSDLPEHSLKIYKADQHFRYLLVHQNTSARDVVMLALQEFGISEVSLNFTLCEVTVEVSPSPWQVLTRR
jgi:Rap guanine nucleotide exchange factor 2